VAAPALGALPGRRCALARKRIPAPRDRVALAGRAPPRRAVHPAPALPRRVRATLRLGGAAEGRAPALPAVPQPAVERATARGAAHPSRRVGGAAAHCGRAATLVEGHGRTATLRAFPLPAAGGGRAAARKASRRSRGATAVEFAVGPAAEQQLSTPPQRPGFANVAPAGLAATELARHIAVGRGIFPAAHGCATFSTLELSAPKRGGSRSATAEPSSGFAGPRFTSLALWRATAERARALPAPKLWHVAAVVAPRKPSSS
jgi:hypothetical protein